MKHMCVCIVSAIVFPILNTKSIISGVVIVRTIVRIYRYGMCIFMDVERSEVDLVALVGSDERKMSLFAN